MLLVYAEAFSMIHLTIMIATSHVVGGKVSFSQVTICMPKGILEIAMSLSDIIFLFTFLLLDNVIYIFVTNNQPSVLISKIGSRKPKLTSLRIPMKVLLNSSHNTILKAKVNS